MVLNNFIYLISIILTTLFTTHSETDFIGQFKNIETTPEIISFTNEFDVNNSDGHLQGIQEFENEQGKYIFMSGSSDSYAYCSVIQLGTKNKVISINKLMEKPFKHAGGFQIFQNFMAVGIEDNSAKDKSKVCIYDISEPEVPLAKALTVIERNGAPLRNTAGCVGLTNFKNKLLIVVGDWDSKHLDFYSVDYLKTNNSEFRKITSIDTESISKKDWINNEWHSYQNINLFNIDEKLYLVGLGQTKNSENIADLFTITQESTGIFSLKKVAVKTFDCTKNCSFKAGAGLEYVNGKFTVLSCGYNMKNISYLNIFHSK